MQLNLITNTDDKKIIQYKIARIVYAETKAESLQVVEAMASLIFNIHIKYDKSFEDIACDKNIFECLDENSERHQYFNVNADDKKFQMCLRVVQTMLHGNLRDCVFGATKFHHVDVIPDWAMARGYITECGDILFYL
nr:cell wall hydrolase [Candidatus Enterousia merdequi]